MATKVQPAAATQDKTIGQLVVDIKTDVTDLVKSEVALAKAELADDAKAAGKGAGMFAGAALFGFFALMLLLIGASLTLALLLPTWASFLVVGVLLLVIAGVLALVGKSKISKVKAPERTIATSKDSVQALKGVR
ncbi:phage holin family protein [uncultured Pseudokineococcus sp.]|uniref:phage holin family protein n=1 Tax=uncultured Pseudokineococcus sp. TaxID=1642928 RepID=UPI0026091D11|nr:phage holin family protein [uncultured Pseudokineococcus sp.]